MVPVCFEIITDNPFENKDHIYETIDFLDRIPGPFTISLFSLCLMPGTSLSRTVRDKKLLDEHIVKEYLFSYRSILLRTLNVCNSGVNRLLLCIRKRIGGVLCLAMGSGFFWFFGFFWQYAKHAPHSIFLGKPYVNTLSWIGPSQNFDSSYSSRCPG